MRPVLASPLPAAPATAAPPTGFEHRNGASTGQPAEPPIPLLVDGRGMRHAVEGRPVTDC